MSAIGIRPLTGPDGVRWLRWAAFALLGLVVVYPLIELTLMGARPDALAALARPAVGQATLNSVASAAGSALGATVLGAFFALVLDRFLLPGRHVLRWLILLPFLIPPFIGAMSWMALLGVNGPVNQLLAAVGLDTRLSIFGGWGVVFLLTVHSYPMAYLVISGTLKRIPGNLEEAARISGAAPWRVLTTVTLPLMRPGLTAAFILTLVANLSDFGIPALIGLPERYTTLTTLVYRELSSTSTTNPLPAVSAIGLVLMVLAVIAILAQRRLPSDTQLTASSASSRFDVGWVGGTALSAAAWGWGLLICVLPLLALTSQALLPAPGVPLTWENLTLDNISRALGSPGALSGVQNSVMLAGGAAVICMVLGLVIAVLLVRVPHRSNALLDGLTTLPQALPGLVIAVGWLLVAPQLGIFNTPWVILGAYVMAFLAIVVQQVRAPLSTISASLEEAALTSGASRLRALADVSARMVLPVVASGGLVVFLTAVRELTISILLVAPGSQTLGVTIFNLQQAGDYNSASALALVVVIVGIIGLSMAAAVTSRQSKN
ncbi:MAG: ABC transporter permease [Micrococcaceae bacterium]|uniref:ABC transporter permease n=1 Tax=Citricoccus sp. NR2 TaxID=3004095 RepID=UPI0022DE0689|nr:iron ABC transporter permease [Citricoccus sp. NR2]WBL20558.1 iron ABC transporter permease [Citricoccus sp. NR2]